MPSERILLSPSFFRYNGFYATTGLKGRSGLLCGNDAFCMRYTRPNSSFRKKVRHAFPGGNQSSSIAELAERREEKTRNKKKVVWNDERKILYLCK